jgi:hypothetical protein
MGGVEPPAVVALSPGRENRTPVLRHVSLRVASMRPERADPRGGERRRPF